MVPALRWLIILGAPLGLGALAAVHPIVDGALIPVASVGVWTLIHTLQVPLAALLGIAVLLLLDGVDGVEATAARLAIVPWVAAFAAFDGVAGLATAALSEYGHAHPTDASIVLGIGETLATSPVVAAGLPLMALLFALVAFGGAAIALGRAGAPGPAVLALAAGGVTWTFIHPLVGAPAMALFVLGAVGVERSRRLRRRAAATHPAAASI
jgi:hypothetical protein